MSNPSQKWWINILHTNEITRKKCLHTHLRRTSSFSHYRCKKSPHSPFCHTILCSLYQIRISMDEGLKYVSNVTPWRSCSCIYFLLSRTKYFYIFEKRNGLLCVTFSHIISLRRSSSKATKSLNIINVSNVSTFFLF